MSEKNDENPTHTSECEESYSSEATESYSTSSSEDSIEEGKANSYLIASDTFDESNYSDKELIDIYRSAYNYILEDFYNKFGAMKKMMLNMTEENEDLKQDKEKLVKFCVSSKEIIEEMKQRDDHLTKQYAEVLNSYEEEQKSHNKTIEELQDIKRGEIFGAKCAQVEASLRLFVENGKVKNIEVFNSANSLHDDNLLKISLLETKLEQSNQKLSQAEEETQKVMKEKELEVVKCKQKNVEQLNEKQKEIEDLKKRIENFLQPKSPSLSTSSESTNSTDFSKLEKDLLTQNFSKPQVLEKIRKIKFQKIEQNVDKKLSRITLPPNSLLNRNSTRVLVKAVQPGTVEKTEQHEKAEKVKKSEPKMTETKEEVPSQQTHSHSFSITQKLEHTLSENPKESKLALKLTLNKDIVQVVQIAKTIFCVCKGKSKKCSLISISEKLEQKVIETSKKIELTEDTRNLVYYTDGKIKWYSPSKSALLSKLSLPKFHRFVKSSVNGDVLVETTDNSLFSVKDHTLTKLGQSKTPIGENPIVVQNSIFSVKNSTLVRTDLKDGTDFVTKYIGGSNIEVNNTLIYITQPMVNVIQILDFSLAVVKTVIVRYGANQISRVGDSVVFCGRNRLGLIDKSHSMIEDVRLEIGKIDGISIGADFSTMQTSCLMFAHNELFSYNLPVPLHSLVKSEELGECEICKNGVMEVECSCCHKKYHKACYDGSLCETEGCSASLHN
ncbi:hypothetical protein EIN_284840 [Entamoeba invadens IP1]|uniref:Uncharacterized protein n=1 Tax=Entamoeba invadens IP1 TaxID=370355 RepID=L7FM08_ENTIV|nr:hypothetical protein EIN_284840 [Entamoeba invadens IP1]ELP84898.1 hypothetical protein EIN_284840 [Entamoeba invadens IP1]|eukprot:XP_004184244.1 hypothetical protein EIN_284840 [Entamoeba invadens IP1]